MILILVLSSTGIDLQAQGKPDIYVGDIISLTTQVNAARGSQTVLLSIKIGNGGTVASKPATAEFRVYKANGSDPSYMYRYPQVPLPAIPAGRDTVINFTFSDPNRWLDPNDYRVQMVLDAPNTIGETGRMNNSRFFEKRPQQVNQGNQYTESRNVQAPANVTAGIKTLTVFSSQFNTPGGYTDISTQVDFIGNGRYNLDPQNILITPQNITLKKAGVYHLDIYIQSQLQLKNSSPILPWIQLYMNANGRYELLFKQYPPISINAASASNDNFSFGELVSVDVYIPAGTRISLVGSVSRQGTASGLRSEELQGKSFYGYITGYLVKE